MAGGRPAIVIDDALLAKANDYLLGGYEAQEEVCPTVCGLACYLGLSKRVIYELRDRSDEFMHTLEAIQSKQETLLMAKGLTGDFNATITKLLLSSNHGHSEKTTSEVMATVKAETISATATPQDAADTYQRMMRGG